MEQEAATEAVWEQIIAALSVELGWALSAEGVQHYAAAMRRYLPASANGAAVRRTCIYYHQDHPLVEALLSPGHPRHNESWTAWAALALRILHKAGMAHIYDRATEAEDVAQAALVQLAGALPRFRYQSRLTTWAHTVVVQTACNQTRHHLAAKRPQRVASFDRSPQLDVAIPESRQPEAEASTAALIALIGQILRQGGDNRLAFIFKAYAVNDCTAETIAGLVHLHPSRVRALLASARAILAQHPGLQNWLDDVDPPGHSS